MGEKAGERGGGSVLNTVSYSVGKIRVRFSFLKSCYLFLIPFHLSLGILLQP